MQFAIVESCKVECREFGRIAWSTVGLEPNGLEPTVLDDLELLVLRDLKWFQDVTAVNLKLQRDFNFYAVSCMS